VNAGNVVIVVTGPIVVNAAIVVSEACGVNAEVEWVKIALTEAVLAGPEAGVARTDQVGGLV
tara:strand:+ start:409 stop:594 length:186 start_codon:yes stop_codon:yes gene_type:complete